MAYSSCVQLSLIVNDATIGLSHVGPNELIVRDDCEPIQPCHAILAISIDGCETRCVVYLPRGIPGAGVPVLFGTAGEYGYNVRIKTNVGKPGNDTQT